MSARKRRRCRTLLSGRARGHHVFVNGRTAEKIEAVADAIKAEGGSAEPLLADVTDVGQVNAALQTVADSGLPLELAIYNAGITGQKRF